MYVDDVRETDMDGWVVVYECRFCEQEIAGNINEDVQVAVYVMKAGKSLLLDDVTTVIE